MVPISTTRPCLLKCLFQDPKQLSRYYAPKMQTPTTPSTVVAHTDSDWFPSHSFGISSTVSLTSLLSSQAGAQFCGDRTAGDFVFLCNWPTSSISTEKSCTVADQQHQWTWLSGHILLPLPYNAVTLDSSSSNLHLVAVLTVLSSLITAESPTLMYLLGLGNSFKQRVSNIRLMCNIFPSASLRL